MPKRFPFDNLKTCATGPTKPIVRTGPFNNDSESKLLEFPSVKTKPYHKKSPSKMKQPRLIQSLIMAIATVAYVAKTNAHSVYLEPNDNGKFIVRFAEFGDNPETSPGFLDSLDALTVWSIQGNEKPTAFIAEKKADRFDLDASAEHDAQVQSGFPVMTRGSSPARKPHFYARWAPNFTEPASPRLTLDIVLTGNKGEVQVFFRNKPLPGVELTLYTPEANDQELKSNDKGIVHFKSDEKGLFMLKVGRYREERSGFDRGTFFHLVSHNCSLTWIKK